MKSSMKVWSGFGSLAMVEGACFKDFDSWLREVKGVDLIFSIGLSPM